MSQKRILIVSQYPLFDQGLRSALSQQPDVEVVGVYRDLETAYAQAQSLHPDVLVLIAGPEIVRESIFHRLEDVSSSVIRISPSDGTMQTYRRGHVGQATLDNLMEAIQATASRWKTGQPEATQPAGATSGTGGNQKEPRRASMRHFIVAGILVAIITALVSIGLSNTQWLPPAASQEAGNIDWLLGLHLRVIAFLFSLIVVLVIYSVVVFRRRPGDDGDGLHTHGSTRLEIIWTVVPLITVLFFGVLGARELRDISAAGRDELVVEVTAQQFSWSFRYPDAGVTSPELNLPRGRAVRLRLSSPDVIHSFWVPEFRVKQDAVPGMTTQLRITPTEVGSYQVRCAELCGTTHYAMLAPVNVMEPADFDAWLSGQQAPAEDLAPAELGAQLAQTQGCLGCHSPDGAQLVGPTWQGVYGSQEPVQDGTTVEVDEAYVRQSILEPNAQIVQGYQPNLMPSNYGDTLSDEQVDALVEYIKSLSEQE